MPNTRSCSWDNAASEVPSDEVDTVCVICCDDITQEQKQNGGQITLSCCSHVFHGQCFVNHLCHNILNPSCPICRADPTDPRAADDEDEDDNQYTGVSISFRQAIKLAKKDKKNVSTQRSIQCVKKWKQAKKDARTSLKTINESIKFEEKLIDKKAELYEDKLRAEFELKYAKETLARNTYKSDIKKAGANMHNIQRRLAIKYGWGSGRY